MGVVPASLIRFQSIDDRRGDFQMVQGPHYRVHGMGQARRTHDVRVAHRMVSAATAGADADIHGVDFPHNPAMTNAAISAAGYLDELSGLSQARIRNAKTSTNGTRPLVPPCAANFTCLRVMP